jgi:ABC-type Na+ efflux pump permease subunit
MNRDRLRLLEISARLVGGRRYWLAPLLTLVWPAFQAMRLLVGWQQSAFEAGHVQTALIGFPLIILGIGLGVRIIADEMDRRTLEIAYTVPGGAHRVWLAKLAAAAGLIIAAALLLAAVCFAIFVSVPLGALFGAVLQALFYLVLAMGAATLTKSEITGALGAVGVLCFNGLMTGFGQHTTRWAPTFNPLLLVEMDRARVLAWTIQNRIGLVLAIAALAALAFARAERREKLLG